MNLSLLSQIHLASNMVMDYHPFIISCLKGRLERTPTPYPKEMKQRVQHVRNLAMKQLGNTPNGDVHHVMKASGAAALQVLQLQLFLTGSKLHSYRISLNITDFEWRNSAAD